VVQTGENWYFQNYQKTSSCWFRPLFLVQTGKTWPIPSFFRLLSHISFTYHYTVHTMCSSYELRSKQFGAIPLYALVASSGCAHALL
jgi:hypothetical protein